MKRYIVVRLSKAILKEGFKPEEMPSLGRIDLSCRAVLYGLWLSNKIRKDTKVLLSFYNKGDEILITFKGNEIKKISPNEREIGIRISKAYSLFKKKNNKINYLGVEVEKRSFEDCLKYLRNNCSIIYLLDKSGEFVFDIDLRSKKNIGLILGDNEGFKENDLTKINRIINKKLKIVSLGEEEYLTTQCITIMHWLIDLNEKKLL